MMIQFRLALVEDNEEDIQTCKDSVARYQDEKGRHVHLIEYRTVEEALERLDNSYDGAIIDLRFDDQGDKGSKVVEMISESNLRIPIAIMTGTPSAADLDFNYVGVFTKGETQYVDILDVLWEIYDTGLTRIMGGRGRIEDALRKVFEKNILPQISSWVAYGRTDPGGTEKALLRHVLNHLLFLVDDDNDPCFGEEFYIFPPMSDSYNTGGIVRKKDSSFSVILTPSCDLVVRRSGEFKTDRILLVGIETTEQVIMEAWKETPKRDGKKKKLKALLGNNETLYYHWLPKTSFFPGGFINFRNLTSLDKDEFTNSYESPKIQISPPFVKDIVARFSSFYARQGQPEIKIEPLMDELLTVAQDQR